MRSEARARAAGDDENDASESRERAASAVDDACADAYDSDGEIGVEFHRGARAEWVDARAGGTDAGAEATSCDVLVVGCGLSGATIAERCANELGLRVCVIDKRDHVGGNCYDYVDARCGIRRSAYGAHLFHTRHARVEAYVKRFSEWISFEHRVVGRVRVSDEGGEREALVPIPPTRDTVRALYGESCDTDEEMEAWYARERVYYPDGPRNGEEAALSRVGPRLYEHIFRHYTKKQWDKYPEELDASVLLRLPCRSSADDRYFSDPFQALPRRGYTRLFENMLAYNEKIDVRLSCDYFELARADALPKHKFLVYTGPIDSYYAELGMERLEYRSLRFEEEYVDTKETDACGHFFQESFVVNYPGPDVPFTRIVEYKHTPNQPRGRAEAPGTVIVREYSCDDGEPYYPVPTQKNRDLYESYARRASAERGVAFVGRLASYKYFNMDEAVLNALEMFDNLRETGALEPKRAPSEF